MTTATPLGQYERYKLGIALAGLHSAEIGLKKAFATTAKTRNRGLAWRHFGLAASQTISSALSVGVPAALTTAAVVLFLAFPPMVLAEAIFAGIMLGAITVAASALTGIGFYEAAQKFNKHRAAIKRLRRSNDQSFERTVRELNNAGYDAPGVKKALGTHVNEAWERFEQAADAFITSVRQARILRWGDSNSDILSFAMRAASNKLAWHERTPGRFGEVANEVVIELTAQDARSQDAQDSPAGGSVYIASNNRAHEQPTATGRVTTSSADGAELSGLTPA